MGFRCRDVNRGSADRQAPEPPPLVASWFGYRHALFGGEIPTTILLTIGVLGWTFEALCVSTATGYDRVVVKKTRKRLEDDGNPGVEPGPQVGVQRKSRRHRRELREWILTTLRRSRPS